MKETNDEKAICGIIMPISQMDGYSADHWKMVQNIISEAVISAGFHPELVSDSDEVSVIHKNIVQNVYRNEIIVCDISGRNPNVMFELGMRLTFDKPVVIIKDESTDAPFDTSIVEYLPYRRDLRYPDIQEFKKRLQAKIISTHKLKDSPEYSPFMKNFGPFTVPRLEEKEVGPIEYVFQNLLEMRNELRLLSSAINHDYNNIFNNTKQTPLENAQKMDAMFRIRKSLNEFLKNELSARNHKEISKSIADELQQRFYGLMPEAKRFPSLVRKRIEDFDFDVVSLQNDISKGDKQNDSQQQAV